MLPDSDYGQIPFLIAGFIIFLMMFFATLGTFMVGKRKGTRAGKTYLNIISGIFFIALILNLAYGYFSGQIVLLNMLYGANALYELLLFGFIIVGIPWLLCSSYINTKIRNEFQNQ